MSKKGCLASLFSLPAALLGAKPKALPGPAIPTLSPKKVHVEDRPAWAQGRRAAGRCLEILQGPASRDLSAEVIGQVGAAIVGLVEKLDALALQLADGRAYLREHDPDAIAREKAKLELELLDDDSVDSVRSGRAAMQSLQERLDHAAAVRRQVPGLHTRLVAASKELVALQAKIGRVAAAGGASTVLEELEEQSRGVAVALQAWEKTRAELA